jgi:hypothetical protein
VGYANESLAAMVANAAAGASSPLGRPRALAQRIAEIDRDRKQLCAWAERAREFAAQHTMERTFDARVEHLRAVRDDLQRQSRAA